NTNIGHLHDERRLFSISPETLQLFNPNNNVCPAFRSHTDEELTRAIQKRTPIFINDIEGGVNLWQATIGQNVFSHTTDGGLFALNRENALKCSVAFNAIAMKESEFLPLYEGKMVD
ncbi:MAG: hypothetical protein ACKO96_39500, partial [Flammeovirgaceae bacterium]